MSLCLGLNALNDRYWPGNRAERLKTALWAVLAKEPACREVVFRQLADGAVFGIQVQSFLGITCVAVQI